MVCTLLSSYNGEHFIRQQIDSILSQEGVEVQLVVRDDGSSDGTVSILEEYHAKGLLHFYEGENLGPARSFMSLLQDAPEADYYAFADQDDVWQNDKLKTAVEQLEAQGEVELPALYFGQTQLVDAQLQPLPTTVIHPLLTFGESLVGHFIGGCTMVLNRQLRDVVCQYRPRYLQMHDIWIYLVAQGIGARIVFDDTPHILYRQHDSNAVGQGRHPLREWKRRYRRLSTKELVRSSMAMELQRGFYPMMPDANKMLLDAFLAGKEHIAARLRLLRSSRYRCFSRSTWLRFKLAVLLNQY